jgi:hypothetical protein
MLASELKEAKALSFSTTASGRQHNLSFALRDVRRKGKVS